MATIFDKDSNVQACIPYMATCAAAKKSLDIQSQQNIGGLRVPGNWFCRLPILWALGKSWRKVDLYLYLYLFFQLSLYLYIFLYLRLYLYLYLVEQVAQILWENL